MVPSLYGDAPDASEEEVRFEEGLEDGRVVVAQRELRLHAGGQQPSERQAYDAQPRPQLSDPATHSGGRLTS